MDIIGEIMNINNILEIFVAISMVIIVFGASYCLMLASTHPQDKEVKTDSNC